VTSDPKSGSTYTAPRLITYGDMAKLTATGLASGMEGTGSGNKNKKP
jgi:hypothetical protein